MNLGKTRASWFLISILPCAAACFSSSSSPSPSLDASFDSSLGDDSGSPGDASPSESDSGDSAVTPDGSTPADASAPGDASVATDAAVNDAPSGDGGTSATLPVANGELFGAASADGSAMLVIQGTSCSSVCAWWSHFQPGAGWSAPTEMTAIEATKGGSFHLGIDDAGNAWLAWYGYGDSGTAMIMASRYDHAAGAWGSIETPYASSGSGGGEFGLAVAPSGEALIVAPQAAAMLVAQHYSGGSSGAWTPETLATDAEAGLVMGPSVSLSASGVAVAVYLSGTGGPAMAVRSTAGVWAPGPSPLTGLEFTVTAMAINAAGDILVAWPEVQGQAEAFTYDGTLKTWTGPTSLSTTTESSSYPLTPAAALTATGDGIYAQGFDGATMDQIESYTFTKSSKTWSAKAVMPAPHDVRPASIAFDPNLNGLVVWGDSLIALGTFYNTYTAAGGWSQPTQLDPGTNNTYVSAFASSTGALWADWSGTDTHVVRIK